MSIEIIEVITVSDYKTLFPTVAQDTDRIQRAINYSFFIIDGVTSGAITKRWELESTEEGYLTDDQKDLVRKAFVVQTNYVIQQNLDLAAQQKSFSFGGINFSSNKTVNNQLCESARNYLNEAGLFYKTEFVGPTANSLSSLFVEETGEDYVPYSVADKRYLLTTDTNSLHWNKFVKYNSKGAAEFVSASTIVGDNFYTKDECDETFATIVAFLTLASNVYTKEETYSAEEIDQKIATGTGLYLGWLQNDSEQLPSESTIGTWIKNNWSNLQPSAVEQVTNNDYVFVWFSTQYVYWRVKVVTDATGKVSPSSVSWKKDLEFDADIIGLFDKVEELDSTTIKNSSTSEQSITNTTDNYVLSLKAPTGNSYTWMNFYQGDTLAGGLGVSDEKKPMFHNGEDTEQLALDNEVVHLTGDETISGKKIFTGLIDDVPTTAGVQIGINANYPDDAAMVEVHGNKTAYLDLGVVNDNYKFRVAYMGNRPWFEKYENDTTTTWNLPTDSGTLLATSDAIITTAQCSTPEITIKAGGGVSQEIIAPTVTGYTFVCWVGVASVGAVATCYVENPILSTTHIWIGSYSSSSITCYGLATALYRKSA